MAKTRTHQDRQTHRIAAVLALLAFAATAIIIIVLLMQNILALIAALIILPLVTVIAFRGLVTTDKSRWVYVLLALGGGIILFYAISQMLDFAWWYIVIIAVLLIAFWMFADRALPEDITFLPKDVDLGFRPKNPVLIMNRWSGGGKVEKFDIEAKAKALGIKTIMLERGDDLAQLARDAIAAGADVIGMAGGDGSLGLVAEIAIEHDIPYVCIPAGTRNHFARDMGLDRTDPSLALAGYSGHEVRIDYALMNDRVFVNNLSLGLYAAAVQQPEYRDNKLSTLTSMLSEHSEPFDLQFIGPNGVKYETAQMLLVSNNPYTLSDRLLDVGKRYSVNTGKLGVAGLAVTTTADMEKFVAMAALGRFKNHPGWMEWTTDSITIEAKGGIIQVGVDGEALEIPSPMVCRIVPDGLRLMLPEGITPGMPRTPGMFDRFTLMRLWNVAIKGSAE
jgi:diacylglycerol kinase family enzyme